MYSRADHLDAIVWPAMFGNMRPASVFIIPAIVILALVSASPVDAQSKIAVPLFRDFPAGPIYFGPQGRVDISGADAYRFRSRLKQASQGGVNFAGRYKVVTWGCGTSCVSGAVLDAVSGRVSFFPFSICCHQGADENFRAVEFRQTSRLIVFTGQRNEEGADAAHFYEFDEGRYKLLRSVSVTAPPEPVASSGAPTTALSRPPGAECSSIGDAARRLACYDSLSGKSNAEDKPSSIASVEAITPPATASSVPPPRLGADDLKVMHSEYDANQARFMQRFRGKTFDANMPLKSVTESALERGQYIISVGPGNLTGEVQCTIADQNDIDFIISKNKGDALHIAGTVNDHVMGSVVLKPCKVSN